MRTLNTLLLGFALALSSAAYSTENDAVTQEWMHLIKADFPKGCVTQLTPYLSTTGANGVRTSAWLVQTCQGSYEYGASYRPAATRSNGKLISVSRGRKLNMPPAQLKRLYSL
ncbi:hypothetical protein [Pseudomonas vanderleydeniana]|uniref:Uncharacterized protein n=1 Tax=Pseudomonas vanderleydeniana TaxID=2745495 RepID=A0A9E6TPS6_9PSED|nr:hypothetical protein [Pseudomonas vanderleydeniana]QXI26159.1 hypothetical protein HU752_019585 [Pseudomonas vanderleydeniana]